MPELIIHGKENIITPGFYMPNRISLAAIKALHHLLNGKVCYLVESTFPPADDVRGFLLTPGIQTEDFHFRNTTSLAVRELIRGYMEKGISVVRRAVWKRN